jgi:hypothetical protein
VTHAQVLAALCDHLGERQIRHSNLSGHWIDVTGSDLRYLNRFTPGSLSGQSLA